MLRQLFEINNLDFAIQNCKDLEKCLEESLNHVRRLNFKYNTCSWLADSRQDIPNELVSHVNVEPINNRRYSERRSAGLSLLTLMESTPSNVRRNHSLIANGAMSTALSLSPSVRLHRNVREINRTNSDMNLKLIKIKWDVESLLHNVAHTIKVNNKKSAYMIKQKSRLRMDKTLERRRCSCCH